MTVVSNDAESVMLGVYAVRNNLFHGHKQFDAIRDHRLVKVATITVERVFILSGLLEMAREPSRDLDEPISLAAP